MSDISDKNNRRLYHDLSWTWPIISAPEKYIEEGQYFIEKINQYARIETKEILNLGCGGGHLDWAMKKAFKITSVDISPDMLRLARKLNRDIEYIEDDMRTVRLNRSFDAVLIHDSINYMLDLDELRAAFESAYVHLKKYGMVICYTEIWPEKLVQNKIRSQSDKKDNVEITFIEHMYDPDPNDSTYEYIFIYLIRRNGELQVEHDRHTCGIFPLDIWRETIREVGFELIEDKFEHSEFDKGEFYPMFIGIKNK